MDQPLFWAYIAAVIAALAGGITLMVKKHRSTGLGLVLAGSFLVLLPVGLIGWFMSPLGEPRDIQVEPLDPASEPYFTVDLRHNRNFDDGIEYVFGARGGAEHVTAVFQEQHPEGVATPEYDASVPGLHSIWHVSTNNVRYELLYGADDGSYSLTTQLAIVSPESGGPGARIPFPRSALGTSKIRESEPIANDWTTAQWADFYSGIGEAHISGDTVTVPTNRDYSATITLTDEGAVVTLND